MPKKLPRRLGSQVTALAVLFCIGLSADAADHFVRQGASGAGDGTDWTNAFTSLPPNLTRGDTYYVADGSYPAYTFDDALSGPDLITIKKATAADHGTTVGWSAAMGDGQAEFTATLNFDTGYYVIDGAVGGGPDVWSHGLDDDGSSYGFRVVDDFLGNTKLIRAANVGVNSNITIKHVDLSYDASDALPFPSPAGTGAQDAIYTLFGFTNFTLSHCRINSPGRTALLTRGDWTDVFIEYCYFRNATIGTHAGMHGEIWSAGGSYSNVHFRHNYVNTDRGAGSTGGIIMEGADGLHIYGNVFTDSGQSNGIISNWTGSPQSVNLFIHNNTFIDCDIRLGFTSMSDVTSRNNTFYNCSFSWFYGNHDHSYTSVDLGEANQQLVQGDPFVNTTAIVPDLHLTSGTSSGLSLSSPYHEDSDGSTRGSDGTWDRGAYEYTGSSVRPEPPMSLAAN